MRLCELPWFNNIYKKIYDVLSTEDMLPEPCDVQVLPPEPTPPEAGPNTIGFCYRARKVLWFRKQPPTPVVFAHELIHLIDKEAELEEIYAYNLSEYVVLLAERDIIPAVNPTRLFKDVAMDDLLKAIRKVYRFPFKDVEEYFLFLGVIPSFMEPVSGLRGITFRTRQEYPERLKVIMSISELIAGASFDRLMFETLQEIQKMLESKIGRLRRSEKSKDESMKAILFLGGK